eukprot:tig00020556_g10997.t1
MSEAQAGTVAQRLIAFFSFVACALFVTSLVGSKFDSWASYVVYEQSEKGDKEPDYFGTYNLIDATFSNTTTSVTFPLRELPKVIPGASSAVGDSGFCTLFFLSAASLASICCFANVITYRKTTSASVATLLLSVITLACAAAGIYAFFGVFIGEVQNVHAPYIAKHAGVASYAPRTSIRLFPWFSVGGAGSALCAVIASVAAVVQSTHHPEQYAAVA